MDPDARIDVQANGPYLVRGAVPLLGMAPVHTFNGEPIEWHRLETVEAADQTFELCRCGHSSDKPFCDGSHETNGFVGDETADRRPFFERAALTHGAEHELGDDTPLCVSAGFCGTRTTDVWKLFEDDADPETFDQLRTMTWMCPSGRLALRDRDGHDLEPTLDPEIGIVPGGPLWVRGGITLTAADGTVWETRNRVTLCRCGESKNKPFCDGTHTDIHFDER